jgi:hypothetical protein
MDPLIASVIITWLIMRASRHVRDEWRHSRDSHAGKLSREHPDWSPGRVRRNARRRARGDWWTEIWDGFPTLRRTLAEDRLLARTTRAEEEAAGEERVRGLHERLNAAAAKRDAARAAREQVTWGADPDRPQVPPGQPGTPHDPAGVPPLPAETVGKPQPAAEPGAPAAITAAPLCQIGACPNDALPGEPFCAGCETAIYSRDGDAALNDTQRDRDADPRLRNACAACGTADDPLVVHPDGYRVHESHVTDPASGLYVPPNPEPPLFGGDPFNPRSPAYVEPPDEEWLWRDDDDPFPEPEDGNWPTGVPHRRNGDAPSPATNGGNVSTATRRLDGEPETPANKQFFDDIATPAARFMDGGTVTATQIDGSLEGADTPHEAMQMAFRQVGAKAAAMAQAVGDDLAAAAAVHGMNRDPQTMADIAAITDHASALQAQADQAATGLASRHAEGAEYHGNGTDADASAFRPS